MIQLMKQTTEFYCSFEHEADELVENRKNDSLGRVIKTQIEVKAEFVKVVITEEYHTAIELTKQQQEQEQREQQEEQDPNDYYDLLDDELQLIEHEERNEA